MAARLWQWFLPLPQGRVLTWDMIAGACRDPCLSISAAPSGACDAIMDFPSPCVGNGGLGSQLSDAQKMTPMLKEKQSKQFDPPL